jgi:hypothetical protein
VNASPASQLSVKQYYASVKGLATAVAAVVLPLASKIIGSGSTAVFPPLGNMEGVARVGFVALCLGVSLGVYFLVSAKSVVSPRRVIWLALFIAVVCFVIYLAAYQRFVRRLEIPARHESVYVSVGYQRTSFANQTFPNATDLEMLRGRGTTEEEIERLWTVKSVIVARLILYSSCVLTSLALLFVFSFAVAHDIHSQGSTVKASEAAQASSDKPSAHQQGRHSTVHPC